MEQTQGKQPLLGRDGPVGHTTCFASIHELGASANSECLHALDQVVLTEPGFTVLSGRAEPVHARSSHKATHTHTWSRLSAGELPNPSFLLVGSLP